MPPFQKVLFHAGAPRRTDHSWQLIRTDLGGWAKKGLNFLECHTYSNPLIIAPRELAGHTVEVRNKAGPNEKYDSAGNAQAFSPHSPNPSRFHNLPRVFDCYRIITNLVWGPLAQMSHIQENP